MKGGGGGGGGEFRDIKRNKIKANSSFVQP